MPSNYRGASPLRPNLLLSISSRTPLLPYSLEELARLTGLVKGILAGAIATHIGKKQPA